MSISPIAYTLALPIVAQAAQQSLQLVQAGFQTMLSVADSNSGSNSVDGSQPPSLSESLETLAASLRQWLKQQGITGPYAIEVDAVEPDEKNYQSGDSINSAVKPTVSVTGLESQKIEQLMASEPSILNEIRHMVRSAAFNSPLGIRSAKVVVTESDIALAY